MSIDRIVQFFGPWQTLYSNSKFLPSATTATHLLSMLAGGGLAIGADRTTLRTARDDSAERERHLREMSDIHRPVFVSLVVLTISGVLLAAADVETFLNAPLFWIKLGLVLLLAINGWLLTRTESGLRRVSTDDHLRSTRLWNALRRGAYWSITLWCATLIVGVLLVDLA